MMKNALLSLLVAVAVSVGGATSPVLAEEEPACLECHEPAEDWEGMTRAEVLATARDQDVKRHKDHQELSDEQLKEIIATLLPDAE